MAVNIQKVPEVNLSGKIFTCDPITEDKNTITVEAVYGLVDAIQEGKVIPDRYVVSKMDLAILEKQISKQELQLKRINNKNVLVKISEKDARKPKISEEQVV